MTIRSLLLGSAAAIVSSQAFAADAIIIEPEPVEYVRVCDAYGSGFFYIPGTETCLRISGYVRFQLGFSTDDDAVNNGLYGFDDDTYNANVRARVNFDARSETEWGTLRSYIRLQADETAIAPGADPSVEIDQAFIEIAGFTMGYTGSFYGVFGESYGEDSLNDGSGDDVTLIGYSYAANGFAAGISLEDDATGDYAPDVVGYLGYSWDAFTVFGSVAYDEQVTVTNDDGWAAKIGGSYANDTFKFLLVGLWADSGNAHAPGTGDDDQGDLGGNAFGGGSEWSVLASTEFAVAENLALVLGAQYFWNFYEVADPFDETDVDGYQIEANVIWEPVTNFEVLTGVAYRDTLDDGGATVDDGELEGFIRFTRAF